MAHYSQDLTPLICSDLGHLPSLPHPLSPFLLDLQPLSLHHHDVDGAKEHVSRQTHELDLHAPFS